MPGGRFHWFPEGLSERGTNRWCLPSRNDFCIMSVQYRKESQCPPDKGAAQSDIMKATIKVNVGKLPNVGSRIERRDYSQVAYHSQNPEEVRDSGDSSGQVDPVPEEEK